MKKIVAFVVVLFLLLTCTACATSVPEVPTQAPTQTPTQTPTQMPIQTEKPTPTLVPTTAAPTEAPTATPTTTPVLTTTPTKVPTGTPTIAPTTTPTQAPTKVPTQTPAKTPVPTPTPITVTNEQLKQIEETFLMYVNLERNRLGKTALSSHSHLEEAAQIRSTEIMESFSHTRPDGSSCFTSIDPAKYPYITLGENICYTSQVGEGSYTPADSWVGSPAQTETVGTWIFHLFKNSPGHYENMINDGFIHSGIGISYEINQSNGVVYFYVAHFFGAT